METTVNNFWNSFIKVQTDLLFAFNNNNEELVYECYHQLNDHPVINKAGLNLLIFFPTPEQPKALLHFLTRGLEKKKRLANAFLEQAPALDNWIFQVGVPPYTDKNTPFSAYFPSIKQVVFEHQVYVHIHRIYNSSNKIHLHIYIDLGRPGVPKEVIKPFAAEMLFYFLGEDHYHKHISKFKIVRRKLNKVNYLPFRELKNLIQFKSPY